eukprot:COSAG01_NODE_12071_length_1805_cov_1.757327_1_plen_291_part_00
MQKDFVAFGTMCQKRSGCVTHPDQRSPVRVVPPVRIAGFGGSCRWQMLGEVRERCACVLCVGPRRQILLQFIEVTHHIRAQHPTHFEFTDAFLVELATLSLSSVWGDFLANSELERRARGLDRRYEYHCYAGRWRAGGGGGTGGGGQLSPNARGSATQVICSFRSARPLQPAAEVDSTACSASTPELRLMWFLWRCSTPSVWGYLCAAANAAMDARPFLSPVYEPPATGCGGLLAVRTSLKYLHFWTELYCQQPDDDVFCSAEIAAGHVAHAELIQPLGGGRTMVRREPT